MLSKMLIDTTHPEETRVVLVNDNKVEDFDFESINKQQLSGNIYLAKVTRVEPSLQAAFLDYGGNRHGFLAFSEIHPDYYQIPIADREALLAEEAEVNKNLYKSEDLSDEGEFSDKKNSEILNKDAIPLLAADINSISEETERPEAKLQEANGSKLANKKNTPTQENQNNTAVNPDENFKNENGKILDKANTETKRRKQHYKIQEVIKVRQVLLVQVVKDERGNKGAALTSYISLAGRYCVLMPNTARGGGISRKITNVADRKKLKETASEFSIPEKMGLIIRTAGARRTKTEIKRDYEYLLRQWEQIRELTLKSIAPCPIYEEGSLIKRSIRDLYGKEVDEIIVDGDRGYREAKEYMKMLIPSHAKNVKKYESNLPLFSRYQVETYLAGMFNPTVQLKSGGYLVIGTTEALVAIDVNSGRSTKESNIEDTALRTNTEAAEEIARQVKLRDLAGLIVIDFIDMDERKNNVSVEKRMKDCLKNDKARIQVGRISSFGLLEMSRQRLRSGMVETTTQPCSHCYGTGITRSNESLALAILRELEQENSKKQTKEVLVSVPVNVANYLLNQKRAHIELIEKRSNFFIRVEGNLEFVSPNYKIERFKNSTINIVTHNQSNVITIDSDTVLTEFPEITPETEKKLVSNPDEVETGTTAEEVGPRKNRRRRWRGNRNNKVTSNETKVKESTLTSSLGSDKSSKDTQSIDKADNTDSSADGTKQEPKVKDTPVPKVKDTPVPKVKDTPVPKVKDSPVPKEQKKFNQKKPSSVPKKTSKKQATDTKDDLKVKPSFKEATKTPLINQHQSATSAKHSKKNSEKEVITKPSFQSPSKSTLNVKSTKDRVKALASTILVGTDKKIIENSTKVQTTEKKVTESVEKKGWWSRKG